MEASGLACPRRPEASAPALPTPPHQRPLPPFLSACRQRARPGDRVQRIDTICIPTANRVSTFARAAHGYLANAREFGRRPGLVVADDSPDPAVRRQYRQVIAGLAREFSVPVHYAGADEKAAFIVHLARESSVSPHLVEFALRDPLGIGYHPGANRNALLLHTAGRPFFCADDDTLCRPSAPPPTPRSLRLSDSADPTRIRPFESLESLEQQLDFIPTDILGEHAQVLGSDLGSLLTVRPDVTVDIQHPGVIRAIQDNRLRIAVSWNGIAGDCGYRIPTHLFRLPEATMRNFNPDETAYRRMLASRQIHRGCEQLTITPGGYCQSTALAFDNRQLLPPFLPVFRGEDMVFGHVLRLMQPGSAIAYLPTSLLHVPASPRSNTFPGLDGISEHRSATGLILDLLQMSAEACRFPGPPDVRALADHARQIIESELYGVIVENHLRGETGQMIRSHLAQWFAYPAAPDFWRDDLERGIRLLHDSDTTSRREYLYPAELNQSQAPEDRARILRLVLANYVDLLVAWPELRAAAIRLRENQGVSLAQ
jgi:hypothetical protein